MGAAVRQPEEDVSTAAAQRGFKGYGPGGRQRAGKAEVRKDPVIEMLKDLWRECEFAAESYGIYQYNSMLEHVKPSGLDYSSDDIERFSIAISEFEGEEHFSEKAGYFLSVLINNGEDSDYVVHTAHLAEKINSLGCWNCKNIIVKGDVGDGVGSSMEDGSIVVEGDAGDAVGAEMKGGSITVEGNAGDYVGNWRDGGSITIEGNAGDFVGRRIEGGSIVVKGNAGLFVGHKMVAGSITVEKNVDASVGSKMRGGRVVVKGNAGYDVGAGMKGGRIQIKGNIVNINLGMKGGEIHLMGDVDGITRIIEGGKIYHRGILIIDK